MEARLKGLSSGASTLASVSGRTESVMFMEEDELKEWVAQVEPGVLITFVSLPGAGNDLKRIRFRLILVNKQTKESQIITLNFVQVDLSLRESGVDQLVDIIKVLGTPTREEIDCMNPSYIEFRFPQIKSYSWYKVLFKRLTPETNLVCRFFQYSPNLDLISRSS